jgi:phage head maturation protease
MNKHKRRHRRMKTLLKIAEMMQYLPDKMKDAVHHAAKDAGQKTDDLELHRHAHSEKAAVNGLDPKSRKALKYVSARTQDRDDEIVIPKSISLDEFRKYAHVLVNHNYSLLPVGSDESIEADDYGIKAMTVYADTGEGTLANIVWALISQGHLKSSSIGFVPTSFTKPGARDWDHVANQLQSNWKEFDKSRAEKSISRIITGGVLLEHSDVSVPCNADAELISVCKGMNLDGKVVKQLGWEMKDGILVNKQEADPVPCVCDECGFVADAVVGSRCPECKTGAMKAKGKEKAIEVISKGGAGSGNFGHEGRPGEVGGSGGGGGKDEGKESGRRGRDSLTGHLSTVDLQLSHVSDLLERADSRHITANSVGSDADQEKDRNLDSAWKVARRLERVVADLQSIDDPEVQSAVASLTEGLSLLKKGDIGDAFDAISSGRDDLKDAVESEDVRVEVLDALGKKTIKTKKSFHSHAVEKPNPHMPGGLFSACVLLMEDKGHDTESAKKICGALQADAGGKGLTQAETKTYQEIVDKAKVQPCVCDECGEEDECVPGSDCSAADCEGTMKPKGKQSAQKAPRVPVECSECGKKSDGIPGGKCTEDGCKGTLKPIKGKSQTAPEIKVIRPAPSVKVLFVPPSGTEIAQRVGEAVEKALSRRTGKIM